MFVAPQYTFTAPLNAALSILFFSSGNVKPLFLRVISFYPKISIMP